MKADLKIKALKIKALKGARRLIIKHSKTGEGTGYVCFNVVIASQAPPGAFSSLSVNEVAKQIKKDIKDYLQGQYVVENYVLFFLGQEEGAYLEVRLQMIADLIYLYEVSDL